MIRHAGLITLRLAGAWRGVLIEGPSGSGKSDLALRAISQGFRLVADDRTQIFSSRERLFGRAPAALNGLIEVRGVGVLPQPALAFTEIMLAARCTSDPSTIARLPEPTCEAILEVRIPTLDLWPFEPSAVAKLRSAIEYLGARGQGGYQAAFARRDRT